MRVLQVIQSAYRCTIEEQDDPAVWITHAIKGAGGDLAVLLRGNAVSYALEGQDATGLSLGGVEQTHPPQLGPDIASLAKKGVTVYAVGEDCDARGIPPARFVSGVETIPAARIPDLFARYDQVWSW